MKLLRLALPLTFLALFYFYPLGAIMTHSFANGDFSAFQTLFTDDYYRRVLWFSAWQAALSTALTLIVGVPSAYLFARYRFAGKSVLRAIATLPFVMPTVVVATAISAIMGPRGWINSLTQTPLITAQHSLALMFVAHVFYNFTLALRIVGGFWANVDPQIEEAAASLGASPSQVLRKVTLPLALPAIGATALLIFTFCFSAFGTVLMLAGPRYATLEVEIYTQATSFLNLPMASALSLLQLVVTLALASAYTRLQNQTSRALPQRPNSAIQQKITRPSQRLIFALMLVFLIALFVLPLIALVAQSLTTAGISGYESLGVASETSFFVDAPIVALRNSLIVALATVALSLSVGLPAAYALSDQRTATSRRIARVLDPIFILPIGTSAVTLGLGYILALGAPLFGMLDFDLRASRLLMPLAHTLIALPFVVRSLLPVLRQMDPHLREIAASLGASPVQTFLRVDVPILRRGMAVAAVFAFTVSMGEFGATLLISRPDFPTVSMVIYRYLSHPGATNYATALAMSVILLIASAIGFILIERLRVGNAEF